MSEKPIYFPRLDSIRFIAFFLVFWQHTFVNSFNKPVWLNDEIFLSLKYTGGIGVQIFFTLSGFLITYLLFLEQEKNGNISVMHFYLRRILRIWPVYYIVMIAGIFILPSFFEAFTYCGSVAHDLVFLNNLNANAVCNSANIGIAWSVAIEEQFYVVWPIVFLIFRRNYRLLVLICFGLLVSSGIYSMNSPTAAYFSTFGNVMYLMVGCIGAIIYQKLNSSTNIEKWFGKKPFIFIFILTISLILFKSIVSFWGLPFLYLYFIVYTIQSTDKRNKYSPFPFLGKYTYGMYMFHPIIIIVLKICFDIYKIDYVENNLASFGLSAVSLILTILISVLSYELFEKKILKLKKRYSAVQTRE